MKHITTFTDGTKMPSLGQGTWNLGESGKTYSLEKQVFLTQ